MTNLSGSETNPRQLALQGIMKISEKAETINGKSSFQSTKSSLNHAVNLLITPLIGSALQNGANETEILNAIYIGIERGRAKTSKKPHLPLVRQ
jgi:hypothetical protein